MSNIIKFNEWSTARIKIFLYSVGISYWNWEDPSRESLISLAQTYLNVLREEAVADDRTGEVPLSTKTPRIWKNLPAFALGSGLTTIAHHFLRHIPQLLASYFGPHITEPSDVITCQEKLRDFEEKYIDLSLKFKTLTEIATNTTKNNLDLIESNKELISECMNN